MAFVGAIDQGTTSTRFFIFDQRGHPVTSHQVDIQQHYPHPGWIEHDPVNVLDSVVRCVEQATADFVRQGYNTAQIRTIGLTTQRETTVLWDHDTGKPLCRAIAWPDTRTQALVREFRRKSGHEDVQQRTGLPLSTYPSVVKLSWMLRNVPAVQDAYQAGSLSFGTMDSWLLYNLTGKQGHKTDVTNASRTMLLNLHSLEYDEEMLRFFGLDRTKLKLPEVLPCANAFGKLVDGPLEGTTITGCMGDQSAALVGQLAMSTGQAKNTYGTGCFMLYNVGAKPVASSHGLLGTVAYQLGETPVYALEGSIAVAGSAIKFLQHNLGLIEASHEINALAATVKDNGGCVFVTAFSGLFAPYWIDDAQGTIFGITQHTQKGHLARATLEASCFQTKAILEAMQKDSGRRLTELAVDGGMSHSDLCMQIQADIIGIPIHRPQMRETTAWGAAITAGLATGVWRDIDQLREIKARDVDIFHPQIGENERSQMYAKWQKAVQMSRGWAMGSGGV